MTNCTYINTMLRGTSKTVEASRQGNRRKAMDYADINPDPLGFTRVYSQGNACEVELEQNDCGRWEECYSTPRHATREEMVLAGFYRAIPAVSVDERGAAYENMILASQEASQVDY